VRRPTKPAVDPKREIAALKRALAQAVERQAATSEALTATADVLKVISRTTFDLQTVLETLAESAVRLCSAERGLVFRFDGQLLRFAVGHNVAPEFRDFLERNPLTLERTSNAGRAALERRTVHNLDVQSDPEYAYGGSRVDPYRTVLAVPMHNADQLVGVFVIYRHEVRAFTDRQITLMETFADQAVIAIENVRLLTEQREALEQQTATAEVLQVINRSPGDLSPVFDAILEKAHNLCAVAQGSLQLYDGEKFRAVAVRGLSEAFADRLRQGYGPGPNQTPLLGGARFAQVPDLAETDDPMARAAGELSGVRTALFIPLRKDGTLLGLISASRREVRHFTEKEIALLENFAAQAVIAMENARLITETREALEQQTATAEVLQVINSSPGDLAPVFDAMLEKALALCGAAFGILWTCDATRMRAAALRGVPPQLAEFLTRPHPIGPDGTVGRLLRGEPLAQVADAAEDKAYRSGDPLRRALVDLAGMRTLLAVALRKDDALLGAFNVYRQEVRPFSDKQIALLQNFAAQAVIAIENARLLGELRQRTADLARSVDELTATGDVLKIISRSSVDLETVLDTLVETVARLCRADEAHTFRLRNELLDVVATRGLSDEGKAFFRTHPLTPNRGTAVGRVVLERRAVHIPDALRDPEYAFPEGLKITGARTILGIPLVREDTLIGVFIVSRLRVEPFTPKEIELASSFADQAVIAIENARLFEELRDRQAELRVTFDNMGDGVVMFDAEARLTAWNRNFQELLDLPDAFLAGRPSYAEYFRYLADRGEYSTDLEAQLSRTIEDTSREMRFERTRPDGRVVEVRRNPVPGGGFVLIYADITERKRAEEAIRAARDAAETALRELQTAQASLVHAQKMAALGQLTAGIAHEIKNPLNFVNNFAGLSVELLDELKAASAQAIGALDADKRAEIVETIGTLTGNLEKIAAHGRRADGIVKSMLQHSRGGSGDWQSTDLNALVEEALNLAYHGARAQDQSFNITMERDLDQDLAPIEVVPQDVMRVFLNLISNGFYAANKRCREGDGTLRPVVKVTTCGVGDAVEIRVRDNGVGIRPEYREKLFQPFFTTKPTGEGTGLGLSISYEIVTQRHGGAITVESEVGHFTEFTVRLPRRRHSAAGRIG